VLVITVREPAALWVIYVFTAPAPPQAAPAPSEEGELRWVDVDELRALHTPPDLPLLLPRILEEGVTVARLDYATEDAVEPIRVELLGG
jgi:8-oxo-dGTP pyrophosphatase MutT (NUDIX family)